MGKTMKKGIKRLICRPNLQKKKLKNTQKWTAKRSILVKRWFIRSGVCNSVLSLINRLHWNHWRTLDVSITFTLDAIDHEGKRWGGENFLYNAPFFVYTFFLSCLFFTYIPLFFYLGPFYRTWNNAEDKRLE